MAYIGTEVARGFATTAKQSFSGDASTVAFTLTKSAALATDLEVFVDNVQQEPTTSYGVSGTTLTFTAAPATGTNNIYVVHRDGSAVGLLPPQDLGTRAYTFGGNATINGGTLNVSGAPFTIANTNNGNNIDIKTTSSSSLVHAVKIHSGGLFEVKEGFTAAAGADIITATAGTSNVRFGVNAGNSIASGGNYNTVVGDEAGTAITTGDGNIAIGFEALSTEDAHGHNTAIGYQALKTLDAGANSRNVAVGYQAGLDMTTGIRNVLMGYSSGANLVAGSNNAAFGEQALITDRNGHHTTALGHSALATQDFATATDSNNTAVGYDAGLSITIGITNTLIGAFAGDALTDSDENVAVGSFALTADTLGFRSVAVGHGTLAHQNMTTATDTFNTAVGYVAGNRITTGAKNTFVGSNAGFLVTTGTLNTLVGIEAGDALTTGQKNVAMGVGALSTGTTYNNNTAIGMDALNAANITTGADGSNTAVGFESGKIVSTGAQNTLVGYQSGDALTTGSSNVIIGGGADVSAGGAANQIVLGKSINCAGDNNFSFGKASNVVSNNFSSNASFSRSSDINKKSNIEDDVLGLDFINDLRTVTFNWKPNSEFPEHYKDYHPTVNNMTTDIKLHGMIAQEVKAALDKQNVDTFGGWLEEDDGSQRISQEMFVHPLIKAVQELSTQVNILKEEIEELKNE